MKKFRCIPIAMGLPLIFCLYALFFVYFMVVHLDSFVNSAGEPDPVGGMLICVFGICGTIGLALYTAQNAWWRVEIYSEKIAFKGMLPKDTFEMEYEKCNVGMDYHAQNGQQVWWIYLCYGYPPKFKSKNTANRMNALKIRPGFIKIMYSDEVYDALLEVLPKKQKTGLTTARRCAGFEEQGKIIF